MSAFFEMPHCLYFTAAIENGGVFFRDNLKSFQNSQKRLHGFKLQLFSYKTAKFQISGRKTTLAGTSSVS